MNKKFKFNPMFGLKLTDRLNGTYYSILIVVVLMFGLIILRLATLDYNRYKAKTEKEINYRYKEFIAQLIINKEEKVGRTPKNIQKTVASHAAYSEHNRQPVTVIPEGKLKEQRKKIARMVQKNSIFKRIKVLSIPAKSYTSNLPEVNDFFDENVSPKADAKEVAHRILKEKTARSVATYQAKASVTNFDPGDLTKSEVKLFNYVIERKGSAYLNVPEQLIKEPVSQQGYRDPDEVEQVVQRYSPMIDYCFRKHTRYSPNSRGFIKVAFKISYQGYVIPESVRIINSTIKNKPLEQCIKNYIKHWRAFKHLDESMGIAQVVQKFVFN